MEESKKDASLLWQQELKASGYEHVCNSQQDLIAQAKIGRAWKKAISHMKLAPPAELFEVGCGGGKHLAMLALNGYQVTGLDVSVEVVERCKKYIESVSLQKGSQINARVIAEDIFAYQSNKQYDVVYHFGVVEHFLDKTQRRLFWEKMLDLTKPGGWVFSAVPNGSHYWRTVVKQGRLCGYNIPEIDYSVKLHAAEFHEVGMADVNIIPWNYLGFIHGVYGHQLPTPLLTVMLAMGNVLIPALPLSKKIKEKFAHGLLAFGRKPIMD